MFVNFHVDTLALEDNAFCFQTFALFECTVSAELDLTARTYNPLPGNTETYLPSKKLRDSAMVQRIACCSRHLAIGRDSSFRYRTDHLVKSLVALLA